MNTRRLIREMEADIKTAEDNGVTEIKLKNFKAYLDEIKEMVREVEEKDALQTQRDLAFYAAKNTCKIEHYKARIKRISDGFHAVTTIGQGALKSSILINGGACVALLAFIGNAFKEHNSIIQGLSTALFIFGCGVLCAAISSGTTYLAQGSYEGKKRRRAYFFHYLTIAFVIVSYLFFLGGGLKSYLTIRGWTSEQTVIAPQQEVEPESPSLPFETKLKLSK